MACTAPCKSSITRQVLDEFVSTKILEALQPSAVELSLKVVEDEEARREQLETLHEHRVQQAQYAVNLAERRYQAVDPANRLVAGTLEQQWEAALAGLRAATDQLQELRDTQTKTLSREEREQLLTSSANIAALWRESATNEDRKQIARLLIERVEVHVHNNSERVGVVIRWSGGFESCHEITRPVPRFRQLESYEELRRRALSLALEGKHSTQIATVLEAEGYRSPRRKSRISGSMVQKLLNDERCARQLHKPALQPGDWRAEALARELGIPKKRLKDWVTRGWATAIQRPFGRTWVIFADEEELNRLHQLVRSQTGQGSQAPPENLRTPRPISRITE